MEKDQRPSAALLGLVNGFWVCMSVWEYNARNPEAGAIFDRTMTGNSRRAASACAQSVRLRTVRTRGRCGRRAGPPPCGDPGQAPVHAGRAIRPTACGGRRRAGTAVHWGRRSLPGRRRRLLRGRPGWRRRLHADALRRLVISRVRVLYYTWFFVVPCPNLDAFGGEWVLDPLSRCLGGAKGWGACL